jgi:hypothetical protein
MLLTYGLISTTHCVGILVNGLGRFKVQSFAGSMAAIYFVLFCLLLVGGDLMLGLRDLMYKC